MAKTRLPSLAVFFVLLLLLIEASWAQDLEVLEAISEHMSEEVQEELRKMLEGPQPTGINDPSLSNVDVNEQIAELLFSDDSEKVEEGLTQLNAYVEFLSIGIVKRESVRQYCETSPASPVLRSFSFDVGVKKFASPTGSRLDFKRHPMLMSKWTTIPFILAIVFPGDSEVHEVIWERHEPSQPGGTLNALTIGRFATPDATALRIEVLVRLDGLNEILLASIVVEDNRNVS